MALRRWLVIALIAVFMALAVDDIWNGHWRTGFASALLSIVNLLLLGL